MGLLAVDLKVEGSRREEGRGKRERKGVVGWL